MAMLKPGGLFESDCLCNSYLSNLCTCQRLKLSQGCVGKELRREICFDSSLFAKVDFASLHKMV